MTKEDIFKILLGAIVSSLAKPLVEAYIPSKETIKVLVKKTVNFFLSYLLPITILAISFFDSSPVDKTFVFKIVIFSMILIFNVMIELLFFYQKRKEEDTKQSFKLIIDELEKHVNMSKEIVGTISNYVNHNESSLDKIIKKVSILDKKVNASKN